MMEYPESATLARQINENLAGRRIARVIAAQSPHGFAFYKPEPEAYPGLLEGRRLQKAVPAGSHLEIQAEGKSLVFNDGANLRLLPKGTPPPKKHQMYIEFEDGDALVCTVQMYAGMILYDTGEIDSPYFQAAMQKPDVLSEDFSREYFDGLWEAGGPKLSAKALLATEQRIPGVGNGCLQDILWNAQVNPQSRLGALSQTEQGQMFEGLKCTVAAMTKGGGRDTEKDLFGKPGGYASVLSKNTAAYACPRCGGGILRKAYMGGNVYFCPTCQPVKK